MKRVFLMLIATAAFACTTAVAQAGGGAGAAGAGGQGGTTGGNSMGSGQSSPGTTAPGTSTAQEGTTGHHHKGMNKSGKEKTATLTGCISASANSDGMYTLSNGRYKSGVEVGPSDKVQAHAGHQVALKGHWASAAAAGETAGVASSTGNEKGERHFEVDSVKHISDTCKEAPGGGTVGHKGKKSKSSSPSGL